MSYYSTNAYYRAFNGNQSRCCPQTTSRCGPQQTIQIQSGPNQCQQQNCAPQFIQMPPCPPQQQIIQLPICPPPCPPPQQIIQMPPCPPPQQVVQMPPCPPPQQVVQMPPCPPPQQVVQIPPCPPPQQIPMYVPNAGGCGTTTSGCGTTTSGCGTGDTVALITFTSLPTTVPSIPDTITPNPIPTGSTTVPQGTITVLQGYSDTPIYTTGGILLDSSTNKFTVQHSGIYLITVNVSYVASDEGTREVFLYHVSGASGALTLRSVNSQDSVNGGPTSLSIASAIPIRAGDQLFIGLTQNSLNGNSIATTTGTQLSIVRIASIPI